LSLESWGLAGARDLRLGAWGPIADSYLWSIRTVLAIEPYNSMSIAPGKEFDWKLNYDYYTLPASK